MTRLAILWHMHQPYYEDLATGDHLLPWVRLHAIKDYWGMVALLGEFPRVRVTFNLVPSLLVQIQAFAADRARDRYLDVGLRPAESLDANERAFLIANGFHAQLEHMIRPYPRYADLHARQQARDLFTTEDLRDLQVWHKLAWMDPDRLRDDPRLRRLVEKQRNFVEEDKHILRSVEIELLNAVIPAYREAAARGQIELSTSPFYHPIMPLLCDTDVHLRAHPESALPRRLFRRPADTAAQLQRARALHERLFNTSLGGVWPSEGALSDEVVRILAEGKWQWTATDEAILMRSLNRPLTADALYRSYEIGTPDQTVRCLFRDHALSDLIGFTYQSWNADTAAEDFVANVRAAGRRFRDTRPTAAGDGGEVATVSVILDGENAWEHYADGGRPFLRALYRRLQDAPDIEAVTMSEAAAGPARRLQTISPGSWINGDLYIWAGHPDDHRAWVQLAAARAVFDAFANRVDEGARARAWEELLIAEGSDWFWWYGDDHSSDQDRDFDELFRRHLRNVYDALGQPTPAELHISNISTDRAAIGSVRLRIVSAPTIDGRVTHFGEWAGGVQVALGGAGGTMQRAITPLVRQFRVAADRSALYVRLDGDVVQHVSGGKLEIVVLVIEPRAARFELWPEPTQGCTLAVDEIVEIKLPFVAVGAQAADRVSLVVLLLDRDGGLVERHPDRDPFTIDVPNRHLDAVNWRV